MIAGEQAHEGRDLAGLNRTHRLDTPRHVVESTIGEDPHDDGDAAVLYALEQP